jgi:hypothetical protein
MRLSLPRRAPGQAGKYQRTKKLFAKLLSPNKYNEIKQVAQPCLPTTFPGIQQAL